MTKAQLKITIALIGAIGAVLAAAVSFFGDHGVSNNCAADHGSSVTCVGTDH